MHFFLGALRVNSYCTFKALRQVYSTSYDTFSFQDSLLFSSNCQACIHLAVGLIYIAFNNLSCHKSNRHLFCMNQTERIILLQGHHWTDVLTQNPTLNPYYKDVRLSIRLATNCATWPQHTANTSKQCML